MHAQQIASTPCSTPCPCNPTHPPNHLEGFFPCPMSLDPKRPFAKHMGCCLKRTSLHVALMHCLSITRHPAVSWYQVVCGSLVVALGMQACLAALATWWLFLACSHVWQHSLLETCLTCTPACVSRHGMRIMLTKLQCLTRHGMLGATCVTRHCMLEQQAPSQTTSTHAHM